MSSRPRPAETDPARMAPHSARIRPGLIVRCPDGPVGHVAALAPAWAGRPTHLVVRTGELVPQEIALPIQWVSQVADQEVALRVRRRKLGRLRPCFADDPLQAAVLDTLRRAPAFSDALAHITVVVENHVVTLCGNVRTLWRALLAEALVRRLPGVSDVRNQLIGDDELADSLSAALRPLHSAARGRIDATVQHGHVTLRGKLPAPEHVIAAVLTARSVPGVRAVTNELSVDDALSAVGGMPSRAGAPTHTRL